MHVVNRKDFRVLLLGNRVIAAFLAHLRKGRLQFGQVIQGGLRTHVFIFGQQGQAQCIDHGNDGAGKAAFGPGTSGTLLALHRVAVHIGT